MFAGIPPPKGRIVSAAVLSEGADIDWGPIGVNRHGSMNVLGARHKSIRFRCDAQTTDQDAILNYNWIRNGGYMGFNSQVMHQFCA